MVKNPASDQEDTRLTDSQLPPAGQPAQDQSDQSSSDQPGPEPEPLIISYGEDCEPEGYLPPEDSLSSDQPQPAQAATHNPDEEEEIEFERFLRLFKEKTRAAAHRAKATAHKLHETSLTRFAHWVDPRLEPYRQLPLPEKHRKSAKEIKPAKKPTLVQETGTAQNPPEQHHEKPAKTPEPDRTQPTEFELTEATPYVPQTIDAFLDLMRRTPRDVISPRERHVIATIMNFANVKVSEIMQPAENITYVNYEEVLGPLTLDRLYRAGYDHFPVVDNRHKIIGLIHTTALNSLEIRETSRAGDLLDPKVYYVREDYTLNQALAAFLRTNCYFFLVIDRYEKIVGLLTYQMLMGYLLGETPEDDFYRDEDRLAVAKRKM